jgi:hypothetical protein
VLLPDELEDELPLEDPELLLLPEELLLDEPELDDDPPELLELLLED